MNLRALSAFTLTLAFAIAVTASVAISAESNDASTTDITGKWVFIVETPQGPGSPSFAFEQKGEALTGTYTGFFGTAPLAGTVKGGKVVFTVKANAEGQDLAMVYSGEVVADTMKGKIDFAGYGEAIFTGKRAP